MEEESIDEAHLSALKRLCILAGDVESNPGPKSTTPFGTETIDVTIDSTMSKGLSVFSPNKDIVFRQVPSKVRRSKAGQFNGVESNDVLVAFDVGHRPASDLLSVRKYIQECTAANSPLHFRVKKATSGRRSSSQTPTAVQQRRDRKRKATERAEESQERTEVRRAEDQARASARRAEEPKEMTEVRRAQDRERASAKRAEEPEEMTEVRKARDKARHSQTRQNQTREERLWYLYEMRNRVRVLRGIRKDRPMEYADGIKAVETESKNYADTLSEDGRTIFLERKAERARRRRKEETEVEWVLQLLDETERRITMSEAEGDADVNTKETRKAQNQAMAALTLSQVKKIQLYQKALREAQERRRSAQKGESKAQEIADIVDVAARQAAREQLRRFFQSELTRHTAEPCISCEEQKNHSSLRSFKAKQMDQVNKAAEELASYSHRSKEELERAQCFLDAVAAIERNFQTLKEEAFNYPERYGLYTNVKGWICKKCWREVSAGRAPALGSWNNLAPTWMPREGGKEDCLGQLDEVGRRLVTQRNCFSRILRLPTGGQSAMKGGIINVPSNISRTQAEVEKRVLPATLGESQMLVVELKRRLGDKRAAMRKKLQLDIVLGALIELQENNHLYENIKERSENDWWAAAEREDPEIFALRSGDNGEEYEEEEAELEGEREGHGEEELGDPHVLAAHEDGPQVTAAEAEAYQTAMKEGARKRKAPFVIAPGEGATPIPPFMDPEAEPLSMPWLFPLGTNHFNFERKLAVSRASYFKNRLLHKDSRWREDSLYPFFAFYALENERLIRSVAINMTKATAQGVDGTDVTAGAIQGEGIKTFLAKDSAYRYMRSSRGSPAYWKSSLLDLMGMIRQLGAPTWFLTLSADDKNWPEAMSEAFKLEYGRVPSEEELDKVSGTDRNRLLRKHHHVFARHFHNRVQAFFKMLECNHKPLGQLVDFYYRIEWQKRGSPHMHSLLWVKDAPLLGDLGEEELAAYIDKYISAQIPDPEANADLHDLVTRLQTHSHRNTCQKNNRRIKLTKPELKNLSSEEQEERLKDKNCRFDYPRPIIENTRIEYSGALQEQLANLEEIFNADVAAEKEKMLEEGASVAEMSIMETDKATLYQLQRRSIIQTGAVDIKLKRGPQDTRVNNYNADILTFWRGNMDIQMVSNVYAAAQYLAGYVAKAERSLAEEVREVAASMGNEVRQDTRWRKIASAFIKSRTISSQEVTHNVLGLPYVRKSRRCLFIPTGFRNFRYRKLKSREELEQMGDQEPDVFVRNIIDHYENRACCPRRAKADPSQPFLEHCCKNRDKVDSMSLITFAAYYNLVANQKDEDKDEREREEEEDEAFAGPDFEEGPYLEEEDERAPEHVDLGVLNSLPDAILERVEKRAKDGKLRVYTIKWKKRKRQGIVRFHNFNPVTDPEQWAYSHLLLFKPFQKEIVDLDIKHHQHEVQIGDEVLKKPGSYVEWLTEVRPQLEEDMAEFASFSEMISLAMQNLDAEAQLAYQLERDLEQEAFFERDSEDPDDLDAEDIEFLRAMLDPDENNLDFDPLDQVTEMYKKVNVKELSTLVLASTGAAAVLLGGTTVHTGLGIRPDQSCTSANPRTLTAQHKQILQHKYDQIKAIIIDEVSMVGQGLFYRVNERLNEIFEIRDPSVTFGGKILILVGDLMQLPPVMAKSIFDKEMSKRVGPECHLRDLWREVQMVELTEVVRTRGDPKYGEVMGRIRLGAQTEEDITYLESRLLGNLDKTVDDVRNIMHIFPTNEQVDRHNRQQLDRLAEENAKVDAKRTKPLGARNCDLIVPAITIIHDEKKRKHYHGDATKLAPLKEQDCASLPASLRLVQGMPVVVRQNVDVASGVANGSLGFLKAWGGWRKKGDSMPRWIILEMKSAKGKPVGKKLRDAFQARHPEITLGPCDVPLTTVSSKFLCKYKRTMLMRTQFPIMPAFASTIHRVQGATFEKLVMVLAWRGYRAAQAYTALSRLTSLEGLFLLEFNPDSIRANHKALLEMNELRQRSGLSIQDIPRIKKKPVSDRGSQPGTTTKNTNLKVKVKHTTAKVKGKETTRTSPKSDLIQEKTRQGDSSEHKETPASPNVVEKYTRFSNPLGSNRCFANATAQALHALPAVKEWINKPSCDILHNLLRLMFTQASVNYVSSTQELIEAFSSPERPFDNREQHDAQEFLDALLNGGELGGSVFKSCTWEETTCATPTCSAPARKGNRHLGPAVVKVEREHGAVALSEMLDRGTRWEVQSKCTYCSFFSNTTKMNEAKQRFEGDACILFINPFNYVGTKRNGDVMDVDLNNIVISGTRFLAWGAVEHIGERRSSGHYIAHIRTANDNWLKMDDERISSSQLNSTIGLPGIYLIMLQKVPNRPLPITLHQFIEPAPENQNDENLDPSFILPATYFLTMTFKNLPLPSLIQSSYKDINYRRENQESVDLNNKPCFFYKATPNSCLLYLKGSTGYEVIARMGPQLFGRLSRLGQDGLFYVLLQKPSSEYCVTYGSFNTDSDLEVAGAHLNAILRPLPESDRTPKRRRQSQVSAPTLNNNKSPLNKEHKKDMNINGSLTSPSCDVHYINDVQSWRIWAQSHPSHTRTIPTVKCDPSLNAMLFITKSNITDIIADIVVNAANSSLRRGDGVDDAIHCAADSGLKSGTLQAYLKSNYPRGCPTGLAVSSPSFSLRKQGINYIVHTVAPEYMKLSDTRAGRRLAANELRMAYGSALDEASRLGGTSLALPCLGTGVFEYPPIEACHIALNVIRDWLNDHAKTETTVSAMFMNFYIQVKRELVEPLPPVCRCDCDKKAEPAPPEREEPPHPVHRNGPPPMRHHDRGLAQLRFADEDDSSFSDSTGLMTPPPPTLNGPQLRFQLKGRRRLSEVITGSLCSHDLATGRDSMFLCTECEEELRLIRQASLEAGGGDESLGTTTPANASKQPLIPATALTHRTHRR